MHKILLLLTCSLTHFLGSSQTFDSHSEALGKSEGRHVESLRDYDQRSMSSNNFDVYFYRCEWTVDPAVRAIAGSVTSYFTITTNTNSITYDLANALAVDSVKFRGAKITFLRVLDALQINLPVTLTAGSKDSVQVWYRGIPPNVSDGYFERSTHSGVPVLWTLSEPYGARTWWPCKDVLMDKADSIEIIITNPVAYSSSSNGLPLQETISGTQRITRWKHRYPIVAYLVAIAVTNYVVDAQSITLGSKTMPLAMHAYPESAAAFVPATNTAKLCLQGFSPLFSEYPFINERYAQTQFPVGGGMEHQTNSFIGSANAGLVAHELAHQWFGNKVTNGSWSDLWLNEGFASYAEYLLVELSTPANKLGFLQNWRNGITATTGGSVFVTDTLNIGRLFDSRLTYRKGGYVAHMLRWKLGDSAFFRGLRRYLNDPLLAYKTARTIDLQHNLEAEGGQSLTEFFKDWVYGEGYPIYQGEWTKGSGTDVVVRLSQSTSHPSVPFYEMPVPLQFKNATRDTIVRLEHNVNGQVFTLNLGFVPDTMIIDPQLWILSRNNTTVQVPAITPPVSGGVYSVSPNPAKGSFTITLPINTTGRAQVFNAQGQKIFESSLIVNSNKLEVSTWGWSSGVYFLQIQDGNLNIVKKLLIVH